MKKVVYIFTIVFFIFVNCLNATTGVNFYINDFHVSSLSNELTESDHVTKTNTGKKKALKDPATFLSSPTDYFRSVASGSWDNISIWESCSDSSAWAPATSIPDASAEHVVIQGPDSVYLPGNRTTKNLTIMPGAKMNALNFIMTATLRFNLLGTAFFYQGGTVYPVPGAEQVLAPASTYVFNGTQIGLNAAYPEFGNLVFAPAPGTSGTFQNTLAAAPFFNGLVVRGNMTICLKLTMDISFATGSTDSRIHTIDGNLNIDSGFSIVVIQRGAAGSSTTGTVNIGGDLNINKGTLLALGFDAANSGTAIVNLAGNINNSFGIMSTGTSTSGLYTLNFIGTSFQSFNSNGTLTNTDRQNVNINNPVGVTFNTPVVLHGNLNFVTGILTTTFINLLTMGAGSSVTGATNSGFVNGPVKKIGNTDFTFPVGKSGTGYVPIGISSFFGGTATDDFTAEYIRGSARSLGGLSAGPGLARVSGCDYWILDKGSVTPTNLAVTAYWSIINNCAGVYINNTSTLTIAHFDGTFWDSYATSPSVTPGSNATAGSITWPQVTTFSPFSLASTTFNSNPLPITINYFNGTRNKSNHLLNWKVTCNSTPGATMVIERSTDRRNYQNIYSIYATAQQCQQSFIYTDQLPIAGINYYRLKITDSNGKISYSTVVSLINALKGFELISIAPNPVVNRVFKLNISAAKNMLMDVVITDMQGRVMQKQTVNMIAGFNTISMNVTNLSAGNYQIYGNTADGRSSVLRFVIQ